MENKLFLLSANLSYCNCECLVFIVILIPGCEYESTLGLLTYSEYDIASRVYNCFKKSLEWLSLQSGNV